MGTFEISKEMTFHAALFSKLHRDVSHQNMGGNISRRRMSWDPGHRSTQREIKGIPNMTKSLRGGRSEKRQLGALRKIS